MHIQIIFYHAVYDPTVYNNCKFEFRYMCGPVDFVTNL